MNNKLHCFNKLEELFSLYDKVRQAAGYDALELLAANIGIAIVEKLKRYDTKTITEVFPYYFTTIKPQLTDIKGIVATLRSNKKIDTDKSFSAYFDQISILIDIDKKVDTMIPSLDEYEKKKKKEKLKIWGISILSSIISGLAVGVIMFFMTK